MSPRIIVLGTYDQPSDALFDVDLMRWLSAAGAPPVAVVFKRSNQERNPHSPLRTRSFDDGRICLHVGDFNAAEVVTVIKDLGPDLLVYSGGRDILREPLLQASPGGCIGGHYGQLPEVRGMATVEWSVVLGFPPTVAIQRIAPGIDTGEILMQARVPMVEGDTFGSLRDRSYFMTKVMLALTAHGLVEHQWSGTAQEGLAGRQYYRMHPLLQERAQYSLARLLISRCQRT